MTLPGNRVELGNWSKSARSTSLVYQVKAVNDILEALEVARARSLSVIPRAAGHSYTDAALNTAGIVLDVTPMHRILSWDGRHGILRAEPGVTLQQVIQAAWKDGWWPVAAPSTPFVTLGGCAAMNVNGRNAWKCGPFGDSLLALDVLLPSGEQRTLTPAQDPQLFHAFVGSLGLLGITTAITVQLQPLASGQVSVRKRSAETMEGLLAIFKEEENQSDYMEAWLDGFAQDSQLGRGHVTCASLSRESEPGASPFPTNASLDRLQAAGVNLLAGLSRPVLLPGIQMANRINYWRENRPAAGHGRMCGLVPYTFWPTAALNGYHAMFPYGVETFQAFVPQQSAPVIFKQVLNYSQRHACMPLWCVIKRHHRDTFLLSYQLDGFSLELNYARSAHQAQSFQQVLQHMIAVVIDAGGRFYLAKDHFLTAAQYRRSVGGPAFETFLQLKQQFDPETRLQSDLYRRLFQPAAV